MELIWYACYGSNMDSNRFLKYIQGGSLTANGKIKTYTACQTDKASPRDSEPYIIRRRFYFAEQSQTTWDNHGVGFISTKSNSRSLTYAKLYLISKDQFRHLLEQENGGHTRIINYNDLQQNKVFDFQRGFYNRVIQLENNYKGHSVLTFTKNQILPKNKPMDQYVELISDGIKTTHNLSNEDIARYMKKAKG